MSQTKEMDLKARSVTCEKVLDILPSFENILKIQVDML